MMIALMIVSIGAIMYSAGTYYRQQHWEEYLTMVEHVRRGTNRVVEISLANYTAPGNNSTLKDNLDRWQNDLKKAYPGYGVALTYDLDNTTHQINNTTISYSQGLASHWYETASYSAARATFNLTINSVGLEGYKFMATAFLGVKILGTTTNEINVTVTGGEDEMPITDLKKDNFQVDGFNVESVVLNYDPTYHLVYRIKCGGSIPASVTVTVQDHRGIIAIATS